MRKQSAYILIATFMISTIFSAGAMNVSAGVLPFIVGASSGPAKWDPAKTYDSASMDVLGQVVEGLYAYNLSSPSMESIPAIAKSMGTWSSDKLELTIDLRTDVKFHDGTPLNATHVKWNFDRVNYLAANKLMPAYFLYKNSDGSLIVNRTEVVDADTVKFVLNQPSVIWEKMLAFMGSSIIKPNPALENGGYIAANNYTEYLIGTGPFIVTNVKADESITFERFDDYYRGPANITKMVYNIIEDGDALSQALLNHQLHYGGVTSDYIEQAEADPDLTIVRTKSTVLFYLQFNVNKIPRDVRRAMTFALNYSYMLSELLNNDAYELHSPIPDGMEYSNQSFGAETPKYNVTHAREILLSSSDSAVQARLAAKGIDASSTDADWIAAATGSDPMFQYNFTRYTSTFIDKFVTLAQENFKAIGVSIINDEVGSWDDFVPLLENQTTSNKMEISFGGWGPDYNDPINMIEPLYHSESESNVFQYHDTELDQWMAESYTVTGSARQELFNKMQYRLVVEEAPALYLFQRGGRLIYNHNYVSNIDDNTNVFGNWYFYNFKYTPQVTQDIPGYDMVLTLFVLFGISALLVSKQKKRQ